jgi:hypothetical protein
MKLLADPRALNYVLMLLYVVNASRWAYHRSWGDVGYWLCAAGLTASLTWGYQHRI